MNTYHQYFEKVGASKNQRDWASRFATAREAWGTCEQGGWLLWWCVKLGIDRKLIVSAVCDCLELGLRYAAEDKGVCQYVIATLRGWVEGRVELIEVYAAAAAGDAAAMYGAHYKVAFGVSCGAACTVALAGGDICIGLGAASDASDAVAQVACAAADATDNTDAATEARQATFRQCADMIRGRIPWSLVRDSLIKCGVEAKDLECAGEATEVAS